MTYGRSEICSSYFRYSLYMTDITDSIMYHQPDMRYVPFLENVNANPLYSRKRKDVKLEETGKRER